MMRQTTLTLFLAFLILGTGCSKQVSGPGTATEPANPGHSLEHTVAEGE